MAVAAGTLYVVATPIGNLGDVSARAAAVLAAVPTLYAEDTRHARRLLAHLGIATRPASLHAHNERGRAPSVCARLAAGEDAALITDAGTPALSDPGAEVVAQAHAAGLTVSPVPGPSALAAALSVAGFGGTAQPVLFLGFLAARGSARARGWAQAFAHAGIVVIYEAPHRLHRALEEIATGPFAGELCVCRELTKRHEQVRRGSPGTLWEQRELLPARGEVTLVLGPTGRPPPGAAEGRTEGAGSGAGDGGDGGDAAPDGPFGAPARVRDTAAEPLDAAAVDAALTRCLAAGLSARDAATAVAAVWAAPRRAVYARAIRL